MVGMNFNAADADEVTAEELNEWYTLKAEKARIEARERMLRARIVKYYFPTPVEGTNKSDLGNGYSLKLTHKLDRKVDIAMLTNIAPEFRNRGGNIDDVIEAKPQLRLANYRKLSPELAEIFDQCIETKPGSPQLEFVENKK